MDPQDKILHILRMSPDEVLDYVSNLSQPEGEQLATSIADWMCEPRQIISASEFQAAIRVLREFPTSRTIAALQVLMSSHGVQAPALQDIIEIAERLTFAEFNVHALIPSLEAALSHPLPPVLARAWLGLLLQVSNEPSRLASLLSENPNDIMLWNLLQSHPSDQADMAVNLLLNAGPHVSQKALQVAQHRHRRKTLAHARQMIANLQAVPLSLIEELVQARAFQLLEQALTRGLISAPELEKILPIETAVPKQHRAALRRILKFLESIRRNQDNHE